MKKLIAVIVALSMVLSMSVMAFAAFNGVKSPSDISEGQEGWDNAVNYPLSDPSRYYEISNQRIYTKDNGSLMLWDEAWQMYLLYVLAGAADDPSTAVTEIVRIVQDGYMEIGDVVAVIGQALMGGLGGDGESGDLSSIIDRIMSALGNLGGNTEPQVSAEEYAQELAQMINDGAGVDEITAKIREDINSGKIVITQLPDIAKALSDMVELGEIEDNETVQQIIKFFESLGGEGEGDGGFQFPDFGDFTLPWDSENSSLGGFLDTILGILGTIGDLLFGGNGDDPGSDPWTDPWNDPWEEPDEPSDSPVIPDTGDVSFIAVAAVAAVAGAALILTRKKNDDAE